MTGNARAMAFSTDNRNFPKNRLLTMPNYVQPTSFAPPVGLQNPLLIQERSCINVDDIEEGEPDSKSSVESSQSS